MPEDTDCKNCFQKVVDKAAKATGDLIGSKIAYKITKLAIIREMVILPIINRITKRIKRSVIK